MSNHSRSVEKISVVSRPAILATANPISVISRQPDQWCSFWSVIMSVRWKPHLYAFIKCQCDYHKKLVWESKESWTHTRFLTAFLIT